MLTPKVWDWHQVPGSSDPNNNTDAGASTSGQKGGINGVRKRKTAAATGGAMQWSPDTAHMQITQCGWYNVSPVDVCGLDELPYGFSEQAIVSGYRRPYCSVLAALLSAIYPLNNETINFWTHFIPFWYFARMLFTYWVDDAFRADPYHWPFLVYLCTVCTWPLVSSMAHLLNVLSLKARHLAYFCDYASLSWYSMGCGLAYHAYSFDRRFFDSALSIYFPWLAAASSILCVLCACSSRLMDRRHFWRRKFLRSIAFVLPYMLVNSALFVRIWWHSTHHDPASTPTAISSHRRQFMSTAIAFFIYKVWDWRQTDIIVCVLVLLANLALVAHFIQRPQAKSNQVVYRGSLPSDERLPQDSSDCVKKE